MLAFYHIHPVWFWLGVFATLHTIIAIGFILYDLYDRWKRPYIFRKFGWQHEAFISLLFVPLTAIGTVIGYLNNPRKSK